MSGEWSACYSQIVKRRNRISRQRRSGAYRHRIVVTYFAQNIALPPDRIGHLTTGPGTGEFAVQLAHKRINDFRFAFVNATLKMV